MIRYAQEAQPISLEEFTSLVNGLANPPRGEALRAMFHLCSHLERAAVREAFRKAKEGKR